MTQTKKWNLFLLVLFLPIAAFVTGCGGGVNGEGQNNYAQTSGTPIVRGTSFNDKGWDLIGKNQFESAIAAFNQVLSDNPNDREAAEANNGLGWARTFLGTLADGMPWFEKAAPVLPDSKVGLAAGYVQRASKADMEKVVDLLYKQLGKENPNFHYVPQRNTGISDAETHAMLAYAFAALGRNDDALAQMNYAKELNPQWQNTTIDQIGKIVDFLVR